MLLTGVAGVALAAQITLVAGFLYFSTNLFVPDRLCHGTVAPDEAAGALGGGPLGRVTARETSAASCVVTYASWVPGSEERRLRVAVTGERAGFPFTRGDWQVSGARHFYAEAAAPGVFDASGGWTLPSPACARKASGGGPLPVVEVAVTRGAGDAGGMARLLMAATQRCAGGGLDGRTSASGRYFVPWPARSPDPSRVCGIPGLTLGPLTGPHGERVREQTVGSLSEGLNCDLSYEGGTGRVVVARIAVVNEPALTALLDDRDFPRAVCDDRPTVFAYDVPRPAPGAPAGPKALSGRSLAKALTGAARSGPHCT
ncbi:hypothetical protein [Streptomyces sp. VRA16 Mangrove soil]|uniref:hypothetical protein n=1 Tax=Streptomyces sp. VRA16 Mangrove soil TaxID=2817434 RepID=UPI001A9F7F03|nr:hypothetical protein [Streptomyces sp. VRA16 Mangrove soil]MBO1334800.1 hypothetical protein [Streptomyces sp. VRA16 Mangrove soil]